MNFCCQSYLCAPLRVGTSHTGVHHSGWHQSYRCAPLRLAPVLQVCTTQVGTSLTGVHHSGLAPVLQVCTTQGWHQSYRCAPLRVGTSLTGVHHSGWHQSYRCAPLRLAPVLQVCTTQGWHPWQSVKRVSNAHFEMCSVLGTFKEYVTTDGQQQKLYFYHSVFSEGTKYIINLLIAHSLVMFVAHSHE